MKFGWATIIAASAFAFAASPAASQSPWPQAQSQATAPWPGDPPAAKPPAGPSAFDQPQAAPATAGPSPFDQPQAAPSAAAPAWGTPQQAPQQGGPDPWSGQQAPQAQQEQANPCLETFMSLRKDVEKNGGAIQAASQRKEKPSAKEACGLFKSFTAAEQKMYAYATKNQAKCGIPANIVDNMKQARAKSDDIRNRVCQAAAQGPAPARAPSLSDALSAPAPDASNIKTGRGTFDTLTGNPLTR